MKALNFVLLCGLALATQPAFASEFPMERVIGGASGDWNKDGKTDLALLVAPGSEDEDIGLVLYLEDADRPLLRPVIQVKNFVWGNASLDGFYGQDPTIAATESGSIRVRSENSGIGRGRWEQTLTIAYRDGEFLVAGMTYSHYDTLDPDANGSCDYNVLTGAFVKDGKSGKTTPQRIAVSDWTASGADEICLGQ